MAELFRRFDANPLLTPDQVKPSLEGLVIRCVFNPGAFRYQGRIGLLLRVAEFAPDDERYLRVPVVGESHEIEMLEFDRAEVTAESPTVMEHRGHKYLTSLSHLRLAWSDDGTHFTVDDEPTLIGEGPLEGYGIEDCRVVRLDDVYHLTCTQVSANGVGVGLMTTADWRRFERHGMIVPPHNKDCVLFPKKIDGQYVCLHRPTGSDIGGNYIWLARSPDLVHWGGHACIAHTRDGRWDGQRIGAGAEPIETDAGWLCLYHGAADGRYCLAALLLDKDDPAKVIARSDEPILEPTAPYEIEGFVNAVVFTNGQVIDGDRLIVYYGAADRVTCAATASISAILDSLG